MKKSSRKNDSIFGRLVSFLVWLTGVIVSLAVAFGMIDGTLKVKFIPLGATIFFGWVVVVTTLLGVLIALFHYVKTFD